MNKAENYFLMAWLQLLCFVFLTSAQAQNVQTCDPANEPLNDVVVAASAVEEEHGYVYTYEISNPTEISVVGFTIEFYAQNPTLPDVDLVAISDLDEMESVPGPNGEPLPPEWTSRPLEITEGDVFASFDWSTSRMTGQPIENQPATFMLRSTLAPGRTPYTLLGLALNASGEVTGVHFTSCLTIGPVLPPAPSQTISFDTPITRNWLIDEEAKASAFVGDSLPLSATSSSGLPVSFRTESTSVCSIADSFVNAISVGLCEITAFQDGNEEVPPADEVARSVPVAPLGDYDLDGELGTVDIDRLASEVANNGSNLAFDLDASQGIELADVLTWLNVHGFLQGDLDLNGTVGFQDFLVLSTNFNQPADWSGGDLNSDGLVGFPDFLFLSANFGQSANAATAAVPEPTTCPPLVAALMAFCIFLRNRLSARVAQR